MKHKRLGNWISILAILFVSLMPLISQAFETNQPHDYQVICSSNGVKLISTNESNLPNNNAEFSLSHCNYCSFVVDEEIILEKASKPQNRLSFLSAKIVKPSLSVNKLTPLVGNYPQAPPSI